jgi:hypothetical protein
LYTVAKMPVSTALVQQSKNVLRGGVFLLAILFALGGCGGGGSSDRERTPDPETWTVSATAGFGGSIDPATQTVDHGATATFTVTPLRDFTIDQVVGCDGTLDGNTYTTGVITAACMVSARFSFQTLQATTGNGEVLLQWVNVGGVDRYTLYHATEGGIQPDNFGIWVSQHDGVMIENVTSPHTVAGLNNGTEYFFVVTGTAVGQESGPSNEVSAVPRGFNDNDTGITWSGHATRAMRLPATPRTQLGRIATTAAMRKPLPVC